MSDEPHGDEEAHESAAHYAAYGNHGSRAEAERKKLRKRGVIVAVVAAIVAAAVILAVVLATGIGGHTVIVLPQPTVASSATAPAVEPSFHPCSGRADCIVIDWAAACAWAFPGRASGRITGSWYRIHCLAADGTDLGSFADDSDHTLNDLCGQLSDDQGFNLRQAVALGPQRWGCVPVD